MSIISNKRLKKELGVTWAGIVVFSLLIMFSGCAVIRDARLAQQSDQAPPGERTVTAKEAGISQGAILTIDQTIEISLMYNPLAVQARQALKIAESQARDALAPYFPQINASAGMRTATNNTRLKDKTVKTPTGTVTYDGASNDTTDSYSASINLDQLLFDFGRTHYLVQQAHFNKIAAEERLRKTENELTYQARLAYYRLRKAESLLTVAEEAEAQSKLSLELVTALFEVGRGIAADVARSEVDLAQARFTLVNAKSETEIARAALNQVMGLASAPDYILVDPPREEIEGAIDDLMAQAREHDPELLALAAEEKAASYAVDYSVADLFPRLSVSGAYTWK